MSFSLQSDMTEITVKCLICDTPPEMSKLIWKLKLTLNFMIMIEYYYSTHEYCK